MKNEGSARGIVWDLSGLYQGDEDPGLDQDLDAVRERALGFVALFKGKINNENLDPETLLSAIREYESILEMGMKPRLFAYLYHSSDTGDHNRIGLLQKVRETWSEIFQTLMFFELEIKALPRDSLTGLAAHEDLLKYRHFLLNQVRFKPYALSEPEEMMVKQGHVSGRDAFLSLYDEIMGSLRVPVVINEKEHSLTIDQAQALFYAPDRALRETVSETLFLELRKQEVIFKNILNALVLDYSLENQYRHHPSPMHRAHLLNEVNEPVIEEMMESVEAHYPLAWKYLRPKARGLGLKGLKTHDIFAPLQIDVPQLTFSEAEALVLGAMEGLHPLFYLASKQFFDDRRIDAESRLGKQNGAFCKCLAPSIAPYISLGYNGTLRGLMTLTHELGHGIYYRLASNQSYLNFRPPPVLAETASTFMEAALTAYLIDHKAFERHGSALLASRIEGILTTVFRQNVLTRFEQAVHQKRQDHLLSAGEICRLWRDENQKFYGHAVEMTAGYAWDWARIPHLFHCPFYCYSYIFGNLLSIILFQKYREKGNRFLETIIDLFKAGSSRGPIELIRETGLNPEEKSFWEPAFQYIEQNMASALDSLLPKRVL